MFAAGPLVAAVAEENRAMPTAGETTRSVTLRECVELALNNNRELQAERLNPVIVRATLSGSFGVYDPVFLTDVRRDSSSDTGGLDPADFSRDAIYSADSVTAKFGFAGLLPSGLSYNLGGSYANSFGLRNFLNFESYSLSGGITIQQPLLRNFWIDQDRLTIKVNRRNLRITELGVRYLTMDVVNRVQQAYYDLALAFEDVRVHEQMLAVRRQTLMAFQRKVEEGLLAAVDLLPPNTQIATSEATLASLRSAMLLAGNRLRYLIGGESLGDPACLLSPAERLVAIPETLDLQTSWQRALSQRPDLLQLRENIEKAELQLKYVRNQLFPSLDVVAGYGRRGASTGQVPPPLDPVASASDAWQQIADGTAPSDFVGLVFSVPLSRTTARAHYRAGNELREQAILRVKQREELLLQETADAIALARSSLEQVAAARRATQYAEAALTAEERKLTGGKSTWFFIAQVQSDLASARSSELHALSQYNQAVARLQFVEGSTLDRNGLAVSVE